MSLTTKLVKESDSTQCNPLDAQSEQSKAGASDSELV